ncbi:CPBP family intramembrane metalloprotease [Candidatus Woesearchaeota archaeon]|nr:CPBP family intramembrane metalloprotease [Candidatus Woesearchaeota archaeon]MBI4155069.1 CPBP family intramembrane metalloprotease [Candidatus Woesearchaeota archaeon]
MLFQLWLLFNIETYFPKEQYDFWFRVLISYIGLQALIFALPDARSKLFNLSFFKNVPRFIAYLFGAIIFFTFILVKFDPLGTTGFKLLAGVPLTILFIHAFVFATSEETFFRGFLNDKIGIIWSSVLFGVFHYTVWLGSWIAVFGGALLGLFFSYIHYRFSANKNDQVPEIAVHTGYNAVKLGMFALKGVLQ